MVEGSAFSSGLAHGKPIRIDDRSISARRMVPRARLQGVVERQFSYPNIDSPWTLSMVEGSAFNSGLAHGKPIRINDRSISARRMVPRARLQGVVERLSFLSRFDDNSIPPRLGACTTFTSSAVLTPVSTSDPLTTSKPA